jgi:thiol-disulfide isomerase/thioredoxin
MKVAAQTRVSQSPGPAPKAASNAAFHRQDAAAGFAPPIVHQVLRSAGSPLDLETRSFMERRFHHDFSKVRIHADSASARSAAAVDANAYTVGHHIVFGTGRFAPETSKGRRLLGHELTHVAQQGGSAAEQTGGLRIDESALAEQRADRCAGALATGAPLSIGRAALGLQRQKKSQDDEHNAPAKALPGIEEVVGRDGQSLLRLDTVTVIEVGGGDWCRGCVLMRSDLSELAGKINAKSPSVKFKVYSINVDEDANEAPAAKLRSITGDKTGIPQTFVYVEHKLVKTYIGYEEGQDYIGEIGKIHESASSRGVFKGMGIGAGVGAGAVGIAGAIAGGVIGAKSGNALAGVALGGLLGGAAGAAVGLGLGAALGEIFNEDIGTTKLSDKRKQEVREYVFGAKDASGQLHGGIHNTHRIVGESDSDDLARDAVDLWLADPKGFPLDSPDRPAEDRRLLILEMQVGFLSRADQRGILKILENSSDADILRIFNGVGPLNDDQRREAVSMADIRDRFSGEERKALDGLLERLRGHFPVQPQDQPTKGRLIDQAFVKDKMKSAYERTRKFTEYGEIAGAFFKLKNGQLGYYEKEFTGTTSHMNEVVDEAHQGPYTNSEPIAGSFHTHPTQKKGDVGRDAPSSADLKSTVRNPMMGTEHYVIDTWVVHLITQDGQLIELGKVSTLIGVTPPPVPSGQQSTLETK